MVGQCGGVGLVFLDPFAEPFVDFGGFFLGGDGFGEVWYVVAVVEFVEDVDLLLF